MVHKHHLGAEGRAHIGQGLLETLVGGDAVNVSVDEVRHFFLEFVVLLQHLLFLGGKLLRHVFRDVFYFVALLVTLFEVAAFGVAVGAAPEGGGTKVLGSPVEQLFGRGVSVAIKNVSETFAGLLVPLNDGERVLFDLFLRHVAFKRLVLSAKTALADFSNLPHIQHLTPCIACDCSGNR